MYLLDSDTCIEFLQGTLPKAYELMRGSDPSLFGIPSVVEAELRTGAYKSERTQENLLLLERFLSPFTKVAFDSKCAVAYGKIRSQLEAEGLKIGPNYLLIAATALANEAVLVTGNTREFSRVPNLEIEEWIEVDMEDAADLKAYITALEEDDSTRYSTDEVIRLSGSTEL